MTDANANEDPRGDELLAACLQTLVNHFDSVRIVVTSHENTETIMKSVGAGNLYAQLGSVDAWVAQMANAEEDEI